MPSQQDEKRQAAREVIDILYEISMLLVRFP
jgi:mitotic-spindle organizing protein 1